MKKKSALRYRLENLRCLFWGWAMDHHPRFYAWADKHLPFDTLPF